MIDVFRCINRRGAQFAASRSRGDIMVGWEHFSAHGGLGSSWAAKSEARIDLTFGALMLVWASSARHSRVNSFHHGENLELRTVEAGIVHEVEAPELVRSRRSVWL